MSDGNSSLRTQRRSTPITTFPLTRFKPRFSMRFYKYFCRLKDAVVRQKVAESLRFDCGLRGIFAFSGGSLRL